MSGRPVSPPRDKTSLEFNPITGKFDVVKKFNADRIITHELTPFGSKLVSYDAVLGVYYEKDQEIVIDSNGNVVVV